jgi:formylglycine-generating enzyme required for sulfatase activity
MAPEQAKGRKDLGPAADVYALGAILYECLTGRPPFRAATIPDTIVQVASQDPVPLRQLNPAVPRDLETICLKCLHKDPARRYPAASGLAEDLGRFLGGEAIRARPVGALERTVKWARRRPALAALLLVTLLGVAGIVWKYADAEQQKHEAQKEADKAKKARDFLVSILELSDAGPQRGTLTARQILDDAERRIPREFAGQPELQAELQTAIDNIYAKITEHAPLAMLLEVHGTVGLHSARDPDQRPVPQALLYSGDRLDLADDAAVRLVVLFDLHQEQLRPGWEATVRRKGCEPADAIAERSDDILMTFVRLPRGTFYMGWDGTKKGKKTEIREDFEIAAHAVTQGQWQALMGDNPSHFSRIGSGRHEVRNLSEEELKLLPVETVSWNDAQEFIRKLNEQQRGRGWLYRLPTEAEWEYACRGGATSEEECSHHFYFDRPTDDLSSDQANFNGAFPFGKARKGKYLERTTRVGAYPPNKLGLCDMHGNVWQWCADLVERGNPGRVFRGGRWGSDGSGCRAADRGRATPSANGDDLGFRLVRVPSGR